MNASTIQEPTEAMQQLSLQMVSLSIAIGKEDRLAILTYANSMTGSVNWIQDLAGRSMT